MMKHCILLVWLAAFAANAQMISVFPPHWVFAGGSTSAPPVVDTNLVLWLEFTDTNQAAAGYYPDSSTYGNDGTQAVANARATWTADGLVFNGTGHFINNDTAVSDAASLQAGSFAAWIKPQTQVDTACVISFSDSDVVRGCYMGIVSGDLYSYCRNATGTRWAYHANDQLPTNIWYHVAIVQNGTQPVMYVNGVVIAATFDVSTDKTAWLGDIATLDNMRIGCTKWNNAAESFFFKGTIDDARVYDKALSSNEVYTLSQEDIH